MAVLKVDYIFRNKTSNKGNEFSIKQKIVICSECNEIIYAPVSARYKYCYNCGAKFEQEYSNRDIVRLKRR